MGEHEAAIQGGRTGLRAFLAEAKGHQDGSMAWNYEQQLRGFLKLKTWTSAVVHSIRYNVDRLAMCHKYNTRVPPLREFLDGYLEVVEQVLHLHETKDAWPTTNSSN
jgi:hypothetical protein